MRIDFGFNRNSYRKDVNFTDYYWFKEAFNKEELVRIEDMTKEIEFEDAVTGEGDDAKVSDYRKS